jgi:hypothetical protein
MINGKCFVLFSDIYHLTLTTGMADRPRLPFAFEAKNNAVGLCLDTGFFSLTDKLKNVVVAGHVFKLFV